jgi:hypothetical protein
MLREIGEAQALPAATIDARGRSPLPIVGGAASVLGLITDRSVSLGAVRHFERTVAKEKQFASVSISIT